MSNPESPTQVSTPSVVLDTPSEPSAVSPSVDAVIGEAQTSVPPQVSVSSEEPAIAASDPPDESPEGTEEADQHPEDATNGPRECAPDDRLCGRLEGWRQ